MNENNSVYDFGLRLKSLRDGHGLSQSDLARKLGLHRNSVHGYEANTSTPSVEVLKHMARIFNCSVDFLLGMDDRSPLYLDEFNDSQKTTIQDFIHKLKTEFINDDSKK